MSRLLWDRAESDLDNVDPAVVVQLKRNAEEILHDIPPVMFPADEGIWEDIMWHRVVPHNGFNQSHARFDQESDGPHNYFLFYTKSRFVQEFEILAVRSIHDVGRKWLSMNRDIDNPYA
jgi:hypothetical protein